MIAVAALSSFLYFLPVWLPALPGGTTALLTFERAQRLFRVQTGFDLPGEPDLEHLPARLADQRLKEGAPVFMRIFKREFELELWMKGDNGFRHFATYPICMWSGDLGPKIKQGDEQTPEGFYTVDASALNPNSKFHRAFNLGYPNAFDRSLNRTGSLIMVHGSCASIGCFAMSNAQIDEIWKLVTAAFDAGQKRFQVQVYPFRMTEANLMREANSPNLGFWRNIKTGYDFFERSQVPPTVGACRGAYVFAAGAPGNTGDDVIAENCTLAGLRGR
jgi:murein L,D-transpeptidase YafK